MKEIPNIANKEWADKKELGTLKEVVEYIAGTEVKQVEAEAKILSGAATDIMLEKHSTTNQKTGAKIIDDDAYLKDFVMTVFSIDEVQYNNIMNNKSNDFRVKLLGLANRANGNVLTVELVEKQKNLESPQK